jgi:aspartyl-tRNA(Asn)/glutamyl-tRNA(Gln) amidotransferase subunit A
MSDPTTHGWVAVPHRKADVVDAVEESLGAIARLDPLLNAFVTTTEELARRDAGRLPTGPGDEVTSPLAGMVVAVKDNIDVGGYVTTAGSPALLDNHATDDAVVVARVRAAGGLVVGKTLLHEFAYGATTKNRHFGACRNPWDRTRVPGGSSGGSAVAVAAGMTTAALGTDTGGSVRIPAAFTGISGLRPTHGAVSTRGVFPLGASLDTVGPMARCFADVWALFTVIRGYDPHDRWASRPPADTERLTPSARTGGAPRRDPRRPVLAGAGQRHERGGRRRVGRAARPGGHHRSVGAPGSGSGAGRLQHPPAGGSAGAARAAARPYPRADRPRCP